MFVCNDNLCRFDTEEVVGIVVSRNRAVCIQPFLMAEGYVILDVAIGEEKYNWKAKYFVGMLLMRTENFSRAGVIDFDHVCFFFSLTFPETPATATERIRFEDGSVREKKPTDIKITWEKQNLTTNFDANIKITLYGYKEVTISPELVYIDVIAVSKCIFF